MIDDDAFREQLNRLIQFERDAIDTALVEKDNARRQIAESRLEAFREVLWLFDAAAAPPDGTGTSST
jgi:hypothetical protein